MPSYPTILFAGGGSGGHIFPAVAVHERIRRLDPTCNTHFVVSTRQVDLNIMSDLGVEMTALPARPFSRRPTQWPAMVRGWYASLHMMHEIFDTGHFVAMVVTGGFVSIPAALAARRRGVPIILVNLDAVPGRANNHIARFANRIFTAYPQAQWPEAELTGVPVREVAIGPADAGRARGELGLDPDKLTLLVTGASQGAQSINRMMANLMQKAPLRRAMQGWQVLHLTGGQEDHDQVKAAYEEARVPAKVEAFLDRMGLAWRAASLAISRAGAGSVAEAWINATPTIFMPYPYHRDQHQRLNAEPLARMGAAVILPDRIDPSLNAEQLMGPLIKIMQNHGRRGNMSRCMRENARPEGADVVARFVLGLIER